MIRRDICDLSSEELDQLPNYVSGLPTNPELRAEALAAWSEGGPRGLNNWRQARIQNLRKPGKNRMTSAAQVIQ